MTDCGIDIIEYGAGNADGIPTINQYSDKILIKIYVLVECLLMAVMPDTVLHANSLATWNPIMISNRIGKKIEMVYLSTFNTNVRYHQGRASSKANSAGQPAQHPTQAQ